MRDGAAWRIINPCAKIPVRCRSCRKRSRSRPSIRACTKLYELSNPWSHSRLNLGMTPPADGMLAHSCRRRCRQTPLAAIVSVPEPLELPNGVDTLLVDVGHVAGSQIFNRGVEPTPSGLRPQRSRLSYPTVATTAPSQIGA